jgi:hypothetical protein
MNSSTDVYVDGEPDRHPRRSKFTIIVLFEIIGLLTCLFIFAFFLKNGLRSLRQQGEQNYIILLIVIICFLQITLDHPLILHFFLTDHVALPTNGFCASRLFKSDVSKRISFPED